MNEIIILSMLFFLIALIYSSAGFGGGSSYLAVLSFFSFPFTDLRMIALICNIVVVLFSVVLFQKYKYIKWRKILPLVMLSVPLAFLGGRYRIDEHSFFILLGITLLFASLMMLVDTKEIVRKLPKFFNAGIGGGIGFLSGVVGIGGGIFLSPVLHLTKWDTPKVIAGTSAIFILVNSIAGLIGQTVNQGFNLSLFEILPLVLAVIVGGQIGVRSTIFRLKPKTVRRVTAIVIMIVAIRLLILQLFN